MIRSFDPEVFKKAVKGLGLFSESFDYEGWVKNTNNLMYEEDGSVGLLTYEYPGVYSGHWFFKVRGKEALDLAWRILNEVFTNHNAQAIRGLTKVSLPAARWAARRVGFKSYGFLTFPEGEHELFCMTKNDFYEKDKN